MSWEMCAFVKSISSWFMLFLGEFSQITLPMTILSLSMCVCFHFMWECESVLTLEEKLIEKKSTHSKTVIKKANATTNSWHHITSNSRCKKKCNSNEPKRFCNFKVQKNQYFFFLRKQSDYTCLRWIAFRFFFFSSSILTFQNFSLSKQKYLTVFQMHTLSCLLFEKFKFKIIMETRSKNFQFGLMTFNMYIRNLEKKKKRKRQMNKSRWKKIK